MTGMLGLLLSMTMQPLVETTPGVHELTLARDGAEEIVYTLSLPAGFDSETSHTLVIALHYGGINRRHFGRGVLTGLVEPGLRSLDAIIAAPDSPRGGWARANGDKVVIDLLNFLEKSYAVTPGRVVITGYSLGGMGTWYIASKHPDRFSAAIPVAGAPRGVNDEQLKALVDMPLMAIHSLADTVVPIEPEREAVERLRALGATQVRFEIVEELTHYEVPSFVPYLRDAADWLRDIWSTP
jgi:predicted peptidase